ncbi:hypothetical protein RPQ02_03780 [Streptomyces sp. AM2-3-1]|uniref:hypothetical protein n=1 Tax=Streptomyces sp. AM2-3-1 TaxID=3075824 RepID=UPI0028C3A111|nr:hypothetical protein [Streptomyces sp. AM2-3-1]WNO62976.1 hypothetical protein RPQ02_03780 [Streptomyces sp. AM2-3-1]
METTSDEQRFTELHMRHCSAVDADVRRRIHGDRVADVVADAFLLAWPRFAALPEGKALARLYELARRTPADAYRSDGHRLRVRVVEGPAARRGWGSHRECGVLRLEGH